MKFCTSLAFTPTEHYLETARTADESGWDTVMVSDHLVHPERIEARYPYNETGERPWVPTADWPDTWVAIGAMAAITRRVRFLQSVYVLPMRDPFHVAKAVGTASVLSGGRVGMGIGVGWMKDEFDLLGVEFRGRGARADEMIEVMRKLWTGEMVEHRGKRFGFDRLNMRPPAPGPIPILVGGHSDAALRRVARQDGWCAAPMTTAELAKCIARIRELRTELGRGDAPLHVVAPPTEGHGIDAYRRLGDIGVTHVLTVPWLLYGGSADSLEDKCDALRRFGDEIIAKLTAG